MTACVARWDYCGNWFPVAAATGYCKRLPAPAREGALMAENLDAEQYRQALRLILSELEDLDTAHPVDIGDDLDRADDRPEITGDRRLQC